MFAWQMGGPLPRMKTKLRRTTVNDTTLLHPDGAGPLTAQIYARVVEAILRGDFGPSGKLPTESKLAASLGVSRPTVREALSGLRADGIIASRRGAGSFVIRRPGTQAPSATPIKSLADIERYYTFRSCIEAGAAAGAAEFRDDADLQALRDAYDALDAAMEGGQSGDRRGRAASTSPSHAARTTRSS